MKSNRSACISLGWAIVLGASVVAAAQQTSVPAAAARIRQTVDDSRLVTLRGQVRGDLGLHADRGAVEDSVPLRLFLVLRRSAEQQADLDGLLARQQEAGSADYHKWMTPQEFGTRFGLAAADTQKIARWLESRGFSVKSVLNNGSMIDFEATAGRVRESFHTQMRYYDVNGARYAANDQEPSIPAALADVVSGIQGLDRFPFTPHHSAARTAKQDAGTNRWVESPLSADSAALQPQYFGGNGTNYVGAQDFYTIYNLKPTFAAGNFGAGTTVAVVEQSDMAFGTVDPSTGAATGGDLAVFRSTFNVPGRLNMVVMHGAGSVTCNAPGVVGDEFEATLDAEWANATAPSAKLLYMSCDSGIVASLAALVDNNLGDVLSLSYGATELYVQHPLDGLYQQAAAQGQSIIVSTGDSGSDGADQNTSGTATNGLSVNVLSSSPLVTALGGTDFSDRYDSQYGGSHATYWAGSNPTGGGTALSYVPETAWNASCANNLYANFYGEPGATFCGTFGGYTNGYVIGGGGGVSTQYQQPSWQAGITGLSASTTMRTVPDVSFFSAAGTFWGHALLVCDSNDGGSCVPNSSGSTSINLAGGTSFAAPQFAGITGLIVAATGSRQGVLNPNLYALARVQFAAAGTATTCYANGQTANNGVTTALPAGGCIFNDVTTGNNDVPCKAGSTSCYVDPGSTYGILSVTGASSLTEAYSAGPGYDLATGLGSVNVSNLVSKWNQGFSSAITISASQLSISSTQSTVLTATVTGGTPSGFSGPAPALTGSAYFTVNGSLAGSCTLSGGTCTLSVGSSSLQNGANSLKAQFGGSGSYPSSSSNTVIVTLVSVVAATLTSPAPGSQLPGSTVTFGWNPGSGNSNYELYIGSSPGGYDLYSGNPVYGVVSQTISGLPVDGRSIYVRLWSRGSADWQHTDSVYTAQAGAVVAATLTSPAPGSQLPGSTVTFGWNPGSGNSNFELYIGSSPGGYDLYSGNPVYGVVSQTISGLPIDGRSVYVRLWSRGNADWHYTDSVYTALAGAVVAATLTSPAPGGQLPGATVTFGWNQGSGNSNYELYIGSSPGGYDLYSGNPVYGAASQTISGLPVDGRSVYVRLWSRGSLDWQHTDSVYTASR